MPLPTLGSRLVTKSYFRLTFYCQHHKQFHINEKHKRLNDNFSIAYYNTKAKNYESDSIENEHKQLQQQQNL